jgi:hypothetical protein
MSTIRTRDLDDATDIVLGRRGGVMGNRSYQAAIRRWAPMYAKAKSTEKKQMLSEIYWHLIERGVRFLIQTGTCPEGRGREYGLVTEEYPAMQRIQRSLQEHNRVKNKPGIVKSSTDSSKGTLDEEMEDGGSNGDKSGSTESEARGGLVTANEGRPGTPLPLLLERKSSAFTVSDTSIIEGLLNDDLLRQMSGYQLVVEGETAPEDNSPSDVASMPPHHPAGPWPEIHLHHKSSDAIDTVSQITECSTSPESPRCPSTVESTAVKRNAGTFCRPGDRPNVTSISGLRSTYQVTSRPERMTFGIRVELQALRARVAAQEGELHVLSERIKIMEEHMTRQQERQQSRQQQQEEDDDDDDDHDHEHPSAEGWPSTVG